MSKLAPEGNLITVLREAHGITAADLAACLNNTARLAKVAQVLRGGRLHDDALSSLSYHNLEGRTILRLRTLGITVLGSLQARTRQDLRVGGLSPQQCDSVVACLSSIGKRLRHPDEDRRERLREIFGRTAFIPTTELLWTGMVNKLAVEYAVREGMINYGLVARYRGERLKGATPELTALGLLHG